MDSPGDRADELTVQQLRSFCAVFEQQSYAAAARLLELAVPTVWEQVRAVEKRYAAALFARSGRRIVPTPQARTLHEALRPLLTGLDSTFALVAEAETATSVTLVCGMRMVCEDLGGPLGKFHAQFPQTPVRLLHGDLRTAQRFVMRDVAELGLTLEPSPRQLRRAVSAERAYEIDHLAVLPEKHPLASKPRLRLKHLVDFPLILGHAQTSVRQAFVQALHRERLTDRIQLAAETDNSAFTISCVQAGYGIGIIAGRPDSLLTQGLVTRSLRNELGQAHVAFLWKRGKHLSPAVRELMDFIRELDRE